MRLPASDLRALLGSAIPDDHARQQIADPATARRTWAVVEANMPWFAQSYGANPARVLDVIQRATGPLSQFSAADRRFLGLDNAADEGHSSK